MEARAPATSVPRPAITGIRACDNISAARSAAAASEAGLPFIRASLMSPPRPSPGLLGQPPWRGLFLRRRQIRVSRYARPEAPLQAHGYVMPSNGARRRLKFFSNGPPREDFGRFRGAGASTTVDGHEIICPYAILAVSRKLRRGVHAQSKNDSRNGSRLAHSRALARPFCATPCAGEALGSLIKAGPPQSPRSRPSGTGTGKTTLARGRSPHAGARRAEAARTREKRSLEHEPKSCGLFGSEYCETTK